MPARLPDEWIEPTRMAALHAWMLRLAHALSRGQSIVTDSDLTQEVMLAFLKCPDEVRDGNEEMQRDWLAFVARRKNVRRRLSICDQRDYPNS